jgi:hypothetical protein
MDRTYIESQQIVARYLSGDLTVREARQFEKYCLENPDWVKTQPIPVRLKAKMIRKPGEELEPADLETMPSNTAIEAANLDDDLDDDDDDDAGPSEYGALPPAALRWVRGLSVALVLAIAGVVGAIMYAGSIRNQLSANQKTTKQFHLRAPGATQEYRVKPSANKPSGPTLNIGWPDSPQWIDLRIDLSEGRYNTFLVTIDSVSDGRVMAFRHVARDSNGELRLNLNSSAFGPGDYDVKLDGDTWRGDTVPVGWVRLGLK